MSTTRTNKFRYVHGALSAWDNDSENQIWSVAFCPYPLADTVTGGASRHNRNPQDGNHPIYHCFATCGGKRVRIYDYLAADRYQPNFKDKAKKDHKFQLRKVFETENVFQIDGEVVGEDYWTLAFGRRRERANAPPKDQHVVLCAGGRGSVISIFDVQEGKPLTTLNGCTKAVYDLKVCPVREDGRGNQSYNLLCSASMEELRIWNLDSYACVCIFGGPPNGHLSEVLCVAWHPLGTRIASGGADGIVHVWNVLEGTEESQYILPKPKDEEIQASMLTSMDEMQTDSQYSLRTEFLPKQQRFAYSPHTDCHGDRVDCVMWIGEEEEDALILSKANTSFEDDTNEIILWKPLPPPLPGQDGNTGTTLDPSPYCVSSAFMIKRFAYPSKRIDHQFDATWGMEGSTATVAVGNHDGHIYFWNLEDFASENPFQIIDTSSRRIKNSGKDLEYNELVSAVAAGSTRLSGDDEGMDVDSDDDSIEEKDTGDSGSSKPAGRQQMALSSVPVDNNRNESSADSNAAGTKGDATSFLSSNAGGNYEACGSQKQQSGKSADDAFEILDSDEDESVGVSTTAPPSAPAPITKQEEQQGTSWQEFESTMAAVLGVRKSHIGRYRMMATSTSRYYDHLHNFPPDLDRPKYLEFKEYFKEWESNQANITTVQAQETAKGSSADDAIVLDSDSDTEHPAPAASRASSSGVTKAAARQPMKAVVKVDSMHTSTKAAARQPMKAVVKVDPTQASETDSHHGLHQQKPNNETNSTSAGAPSLRQQDNSDTDDEDKKPPAKKLPPPKKKKKPSFSKSKKQKKATIPPMKGGNSFLKQAFSPDGNTLVSIDSCGIIFQWERDACSDNEDENDAYEAKVKASDSFNSDNASPIGAHAYSVNVKQDGEDPIVNSTETKMEMELEL